MIKNCDPFVFGPEFAQGSKDALLSKSVYLGTAAFVFNLKKQAPSPLKKIEKNLLPIKKIIFGHMVKSKIENNLGLKNKFRNHLWEWLKKYHTYSLCVLFLDGQAPLEVSPEAEGRRSSWGRRST